MRIEGRRYRGRMPDLPQRPRSAQRDQRAGARGAICAAWCRARSVPRSTTSSKRSRRRRSRRGPTRCATSASSWTRATTSARRRAVRSTAAWRTRIRSPTGRSPRPRARCALTRAQPADALYSSTCGGHTEDVREMFPLKRDAYLRAVPCLEAGDAARRRRAAPTPHSLTACHAGCCHRRRRRSTEPTLGAALGAARGACRLAGAAAIRRLVARSPRACSVRRRRSSISRADARAVRGARGPALPARGPPAGWGAEDLRLAAYLGEERPLSPAPPERPLGPTRERGAAAAPGDLPRCASEDRRFLSAVSPTES